MSTNTKIKLSEKMTYLLLNFKLVFLTPILNSSMLVSQLVLGLTFRGGVSLFVDILASNLSNVPELETKLKFLSQ